jgi:vesicle coat complex subunit
VIKKMCYMYLSAYAERNPEVTLLVVNTMQKDCADEDPMVRGLALRSLTSLRLASITEYALPLVQRSMEDLSGYVRKTAVLAVLKLFHASPAEVKTADLTDSLYNMIRDRDTAVVINAIRALDEMLMERGGIAVNQTMIHHLLGRLKDFNDWEQCTVLDLVTRYTAEGGEDEMFAIMNILDPALRNRNSAVGLATIKVMLHLTSNPELSDVREQVYERCKTPLLTLLASATPESSFVILSHVLALVERSPQVFAADYKTFFCGLGEPSHVQELKMDLLSMIAVEATAAPIVNELCEYVTGVDEGLVRKSITSIGKIAVNLPRASPGVIGALLSMLETDSEWVRSQTLKVMCDVLRKYPAAAKDVLPALHATLRSGSNDAEGRAAAVWLIGQYGTLLDDAPYLLEPMIDAVVASVSAGAAVDPLESRAAKDVGDELYSSEVKLELLTAAMKLFFARPPESQKMLSRLLSACLTEGEDAGVRDRALLYYRLLRANVDTAKDVVGSGTEAVKEFLRDTSASVREAVFAEFNSLSVVFGKPSVDFVPESHRPVSSEDDDASDTAVAASHVIKPAAVSHATKPVVHQPPLAPSPVEDLFGPGGPAPAPASGSPPPPTDDLGDLFGPVAAKPPPRAAASGGDMLDLFGAAPSPAPAPATLTLDASANLEPAAFQTKWGSAAAGPNASFGINPSMVNGPRITALVGGAHIKQVAFGDTGGGLRFFFYARPKDSAAAMSGGGFHMLQVNMEKASGAVTVTSKTEDPSTVNAMLALFKRVVS